MVVRTGLVVGDSGIDHYKWFYHMERMDEVRLPRRIYRVELDSLSRNEMD